MNWHGGVKVKYKTIYADPRLFGVRGNLPYKIVDGKRQQGVTGFFAPRTEHSKKPEDMREMIETVSYAPRIELFARERFDGWDCWGNEV